MEPDPLVGGGGRAGAGQHPAHQGPVRFAQAVAAHEVVADHALARIERIGPFERGAGELELPGLRKDAAQEPPRLAVGGRDLQHRPNLGFRLGVLLFDGQRPHQVQTPGGGVGRGGGSGPKRVHRFKGPAAA